MSKFADKFDEELERLRANKTVQQLENRYNGLSQRDQLLVKIFAVVIGLLLLYQVILSPCMAYMSEAQSRYKQRLGDNEWIESKLPEAKAAFANSSSSNREGSLLSLASSSASEFSLNFNRFEPMGDDRVRLWLERVSFDDVVQWLAKLEQEQGVSTSDISIDSNQVGFVNVRLTLEG